MSLKYSQLKDKPKHRLEAMGKRMMSNIQMLERIIVDCRNHKVPLSDEAHNYILERMSHYYKEKGKIANIINYRFNGKYKGGLGRWAFEPVPKRDLSFIPEGSTMNIHYAGKLKKATVIKNDTTKRSITLRINVGFIPILEELFKVGIKETYSWTSYKFDDYNNLNLKEKRR